jgi:inosine-uridine nucleoside N-ribohydrolase
MAHNVVLIVDPGIDGAFAVALALHDPDLAVLALAATAGNVSAEVATRNVHILVEQMDPPRWPRIGAALPVSFDVDGTRLHGPGGLGGVSFPCSELHRPHPADKLLVDMVNQNPKDVTVVCMGPPSVVARALDRAPDLPAQVKRLVLLGGAVDEPGNAGPVSEFHFYCDPLSARQVLRCGAPITLIPLDVMRRVLFSPTDLLDLPAKESRTCRFLRQIVPYGIGATSNLYGLEGFHLKDVLGVVAVALPSAISTKKAVVDVETRGELTRGMSVVDRRPHPSAEPNVELAVGVDGAAVRSYIDRVLCLTE